MTRLRLLDEAAATGHDAKTVSDAMQALYERGYISYPYTECEFIPAVQAGEAQSIVAAIAMVAPEVETRITVNAKSPVFVQEFVWAHHAIIPWKETLWTSSIDDAHPLAREIYLLVAKAYLDAISASTSNLAEVAAK